MTPPLIPLHPPGNHDPIPLTNLYRDLPLPRGDDRLYVYGNFVTSLDGRIALGDGLPAQTVPGSIANRRDWRLFQELAARADILLSSGRYFRDLQAGRAQDILPLGTDYGDLVAWRQDQGLPGQPDVVVLSATLDFPLPELLFRQGRRVWVATVTGASPRARDRLERQGATVIDCGAGPRVDAARLTRHLAAEGYRRAYSVTGPWVMHELLRAGVLESLFLTHRLRIVAGADYATITEGPVLAPPADFDLVHLYLDREGDGRAGQLFARYDRRSGPGPVTSESRPG
ncbi:RibD family protein [Alkalilimnicola ehrlichii MLHE-1]|uniref:Pyrimidine reductase, riboflavin biosynthesis, RibD n=1 Tax=Alkalilimnicola ehrlichii (strain ATCC BAA-1101 / DSM 17681 / MLHE-1) TaxID=187272 RepID=Q0A8X8_ALKEH|nr:dihydrofolate reductase family protein [Alkalilimnicola ehrlichii]ABI56709.1 pyrimidine reductase, riboflavin biosynthesis, RibD [Alkalilimnicola ehrlichii MLHE-1]